MRLWAGAALALLGGSAAWAKPCPAVIGVAKDGSFYNERGGAWVQQSPKVLQAVLAGGCYPEGGPSPTSSVMLYLAASAPPMRVVALYRLLEESGWPKNRVETKG